MMKEFLENSFVFKAYFLTSTKKAHDTVRKSLTVT